MKVFATISALVAGACAAPAGLFGHGVAAPVLGHGIGHGIGHLGHSVHAAPLLGHGVAHGIGHGVAHGIGHGIGHGVHAAPLLGHGLGHVAHAVHAAPVVVSISSSSDSVMERGEGSGSDCLGSAS